MTTVGSTARASAGRGRELGQGLAELALVTPILVFLLTNAVREAARRAAADPSPTEAGVRAQLDALLAANIQGYEASRVTSTAVTIADYCLNAENNNRIQVTVSYGHPVFFPLLDYATDLVDGIGDDKWTLSASAQMRLETTQNPGPC